MQYIFEIICQKPILFYEYYLLRLFNEIQNAIFNQLYELDL